MFFALQHSRLTPLLSITVKEVWTPSLKLDLLQPLGATSGSLL
jgi:hypothetical protein